MKLTQIHKNTINAIIAARMRISLDQEAVKDDIAALSAELGVKPSYVQRLVTLVTREQNKGGVIQEESKLLEMAEQMLGESTDCA